MVSARFIMECMSSVGDGGLDYAQTTSTVGERLMPHSTRRAAPKEDCPSPRESRVSAWEERHSGSAISYLGDNADNDQRSILTVLVLSPSLSLARTVNKRQ